MNFQLFRSISYYVVVMHKYCSITLVRSIYIYDKSFNSLRWRNNYSSCRTFLEFLVTLFTSFITMKTSQRSQWNCYSRKVLDNPLIIVCNRKKLLTSITFFDWYQSITAATLDWSPITPSFEIIWSRNKTCFIQKSHLLNWHTIYYFLIFLVFF